MRRVGLLATIAVVITISSGMSSAQTSEPWNGPVTNEGYPIREKTEVFDYTGAPVTWTVPDGIVAIRIEVKGASGGLTLGDVPGGAGGQAIAVFDVKPFQSLQINAGGRGDNKAECQQNYVPCSQWGTPPNCNKASSRGGFNGGGAGDNCDQAAGGGGASDVRTGDFSLQERIIVAGGGGGAVNSGACGTGGAGGGLTGGSGMNGGETNSGQSTYRCPWGGGASQTAGGEGRWEQSGAGGSGSLGLGGNGNLGGGGGGGWYGGGGGAQDNGDETSGGGGSGYIIPSARNPSMAGGDPWQQSNGVVTITYGGESEDLKGRYYQ